MNFTADTWWLFGLIVTGAIAIIGFFLKRTINETGTTRKLKRYNCLMLRKMSLKMLKMM